MRRALLLIVGFGIGGLLLLALCVSAADQYTYAHRTAMPGIPTDIEGTFLQAVQLAAYEGPFWEDGTAEEVVDVAALVLENTGSHVVSEGAVVLDWGTDRMVFELSWLLPGERVVVLEKERKLFRTMRDARIYGWTTTLYPKQIGAVTVEETGDTELSFVNHTSDTIPGAAAMFKHYDVRSGMYIGGITYTMEVSQLQPGEVRSVTPWRYTSGYSRVVWVQWE